MTFDVSMHNWMRQEPLEATVARLARLGYDGIELSGEPERYDTEQVRGLLAPHGLKCWGRVPHTGVDGRALTHADPAIRRSAVAYVKACLTMAAELGGRIITLV